MSLESKIDLAIQTNNYATLSSVFSSFSSTNAIPPSASLSNSWQSLGQGEQKTLASYFVKASTSSPTFLPAAFSSPVAMRVFQTTLAHLPPTVENAADNVLRHKLFDYLVEEEQDYHLAATILAGVRMEDQADNVYFMTPAQKCNTYVQIAECYLQEGEEFLVEADGAVTKAGTVVEGITDPDQHVALILRYKSTYARVLDANRKFLQAASRYYDLSQAPQSAEGDDEDMVVVDSDDLLHMLGRAATCAILAKSGPQRQRILGLVYKDKRLSQLDALPEFQTHAAVLTKMYKSQLIHRDDDLIKFEDSLAHHQKAIMADGLTIVERALIEHNMFAVSKLYTTISFTNLGDLLGLSADKAEKVAAKMIMDGSLEHSGGSIDQVDSFVCFEENQSALLNWDESITEFCVQLNRVTDAVRQF